jgi:hypothetical protein
MIQPTHNPQHGPARALLELLTEYPELPQLSWNINIADSDLRGELYGPEAPAAFAAWAAALEAKPWEPLTFWADNGELLTSHRFATTWRNVRVSVGFYSSAEAGRATGAVAA